MGHVEWVQFARVPQVPGAGEVMHAHHPFEEPAGGGAVAAVQLARLAGEAMLITALGEDEQGRLTVSRLGELGVHVRAAWRTAPTRRAVTLLDDAGERTIVTFGARLEPVIADDELPWSELAHMDAVYFTAGDLGALRAARAARRLLCNPRALDALGHGVRLDGLVLSAEDTIEQHEAARALVRLSLRSSPKAPTAAPFDCATAHRGDGLPPIHPTPGPTIPATPTAAATRLPQASPTAWGQVSS